MIRDEVVLWASLASVVFLAFVLMPSYEHFKDSAGNEVDVDPNAPPLPPGLPPPSTVDSNIPSGVVAMPSINMPENIKGPYGMPPVKRRPAPKKPFSNTLPAPDYSNEDSGVNGRDKYVLKSSLQPCSCPSQSMSCPQHFGSQTSSTSPGDMDDSGDMKQWPPTGDDAIKKPFSTAFTNENEPVGYLNSFSSFTR
jgi:hypothetical protein